MGQMTNGKSKKEVKEGIKKEEIIEDEGEEEQEQDGVSVLSPCKINSSSLSKVRMVCSLIESVLCVGSVFLASPFPFDWIFRRNRRWIWS